MIAATEARAAQIRSYADYHAAVADFRQRRHSDEENRVNALLAEVIAALAPLLVKERDRSATTGTRRKTTGPCASCGKPRPEHAWLQGWACSYCGTCHRRWRRHGSPPGGPPPPRSRATRPAWLEDYGYLRSWGVGDEEAARRLGVSVGTIERYRDRRETAGVS